MFSKLLGRGLWLAMFLVLLPVAARAQDASTDTTEITVITDEEMEVPIEEIHAIIETNLGSITLLLYAEDTPKTVENFVGLAEKGYYENVIFHRVIPNFMMQGGDPTGTGMGGRSLWGEPFEDEIVEGLVFDRRGQLAMANAGPGTNGSQFFITFAPTPWLTGKHTIFGEVIAGQEVLDAVENAPIGPRDKPIDDIVMLSVTIERGAAE
jgi:cyclophilin family peptidyl-prolyl cis-trans isomerase